MEEAPLLENREIRRWVAITPTWEAFVGELTKVGSIATPMAVVNVSQFLLQTVSISMAGHLSEISLSGTAIASSFANVTGLSVLMGMAGALETLCGQAYGAEQYQKVGIYAYCAIVSLILVCLPISVLWIFMEKILISIGIDSLISHEAGKYTMWLIAALFPCAILQPLIRFLQTQSQILPMLLSSVTTLCFHIPICWALVFKLKMGNSGAALAIAMSYWLNTIMLGVYIMHSSACEKTRAPFSKDVFLSIGEFFRYAVPSALMACLEWSSYELLVLLSGLLPDAELETSVLSICMTTASLHFSIAFSFGAAASTRVSNELGAGNPQAARLAVWAVMALEAAEVSISMTTLFCCQHVLGYGFSDDKEVVDYVAEITPLLCLSITMDSFQATLSGVARGSGWQHIGAGINLGVYYMVAIPVALVLGFVVQMGGQGFWIGITTGPTLQFILFSILASLTDWHKQATKARERVLKGEISI